MGSEAKTVSIQEWARQVGVGRSLAYSLAKKGEIPGQIKLGGRWLISRAAMDKMLGADTTSPRKAMVH